VDLRNTTGRASGSKSLAVSFICLLYARLTEISSTNNKTTVIVFTSRKFVADAPGLGNLIAHGFMVA
jgi:hypothetical protein